MGKKVAVAFVHGMGEAKKDFANDIKNLILDTLGTSCIDDIVMGDVYWADVFQTEEDQLVAYAKTHNLSNPITLREFVINYLADVVAYQVRPGERRDYNSVHIRFAQTLKELAASAGPDAPLIVIAHSLGSLIASNYLYDLQHDFQGGITRDFIKKCVEKPKPAKKSKLIPAAIGKHIGSTPLEQGKTLINFYTLGCPLAIYNMRHKNPVYGLPIEVPSPKLSDYHPKLSGEWVNFYDPDDIIAYPLQGFNDCYKDGVRDMQVDAGPIFLALTPLSHSGYWTCREVIEEITGQLLRICKRLNP